MLTAIVLTHNEAPHLGNCLAALSFCDHVLIIDDNSTDSTLSVAKKYSTTVLVHSLNGDFAAQRNWAMTHVTSGWLLFVDPDELVSSELAREIRHVINDPKLSAYYIHRHDYLWGKRLSHGDLQDAKYIRLARVGSGEWLDPVHEYWYIKDKLGTLNTPLQHFPHTSIVSFLHKLNLYSTIRAQQFIASGRQITLVHIIFAPVYKFVYLYLFKFGFLDGTPGFIHAMLMSFYTFLVAAKAKL